MVPLVVPFALAGVLVGSAVARISWRLPLGEPLFSQSLSGGGTPPDVVERRRPDSGAASWRDRAIVAAAAVIGIVAALAVPAPGMFAAAGLGWSLLLLAVLDLEHLWLPSAITLPLAAAGLAATALLDPAALPAHVVGGAVGFASLAGVAAGYRALRRRTGLGGGDARLFAAAGAWLGWQALPLVLLAAAVAGLVVAAVLWRRGATAATRLPFGAFLAPAIWGAYLLR